jgi:hypothetical protein
VSPKWWQIGAIDLHLGSQVHAYHLPHWVVHSGNPSSGHMHVTLRRTSRPQIIIKKWEGNNTRRSVRHVRFYQRTHRSNRPPIEPHYVTDNHPRQKSFSHFNHWKSSMIWSLLEAANPIGSMNLNANPDALFLLLWFILNTLRTHRSPGLYTRKMGTQWRAFRLLSLPGDMKKKKIQAVK